MQRHIDGHSVVNDHRYQKEDFSTTKYVCYKDLADSGAEENCTYISKKHTGNFAEKTVEKEHPWVRDRQGISTSWSPRRTWQGQWPQWAGCLALSQYRWWKIMPLVHWDWDWGLPGKILWHFYWIPLSLEGLFQRGKMRKQDLPGTVNRTLNPLCHRAAFLLLISTMVNT